MGAGVAGGRLGCSSAPVLSTSEQFQAYVKAGQQAEAEEWLSRLVNSAAGSCRGSRTVRLLLESQRAIPPAQPCNIPRPRIAPGASKR